MVRRSLFASFAACPHNSCCVKPRWRLIRFTRVDVSALSHTVCTGKHSLIVYLFISARRMQARSQMNSLELWDILENVVKGLCASILSFFAKQQMSWSFLHRSIKGSKRSLTSSLPVLLLHFLVVSFWSKLHMRSCVKTHFIGPLSYNWVYICLQECVHCCYYMVLLQTILDGPLRPCESFLDASGGQLSMETG